jgi:uncharacterized protein
MEKEIRIENQADHITLAGTLTSPDDVIPSTLVILLHGTGGHTSDQLINTPNGPLQMFKLLSDYLVSAGIAVLRYDKRGAGKSTGLPYPKAIYQDYERDAVCAIQYARQQTDVPFQKLGLVGHSEGCTVAIMVEAEARAVDFIALLAPPGKRGDIVWREQSKLMAAQQGAPENVLDLLDAFNQKAVETLSTGAGEDDVMRILNDYIKHMPAEDQQTLGVPEEGLPKEGFAELLAPCFRDFITIDPQDYYRKISVPILAVYGSKDIHVPPAENAAVIRQALASNSNHQFTVREVLGLNHFFFAEPKPGEAKPVDGENIFPIDHAEIVADWIKGLS